MTVLRAGRDPDRRAHSRRPGPARAFYFEKVADRAVWDFALVSVAAAFRLDGETHPSTRAWSVAPSACVPRRLEAVAGAAASARRATRTTAKRAAALAVEGAQPLNFNAFKIPLMENLVRRAIRGA